MSSAGKGPGPSADRRFMGRALELARRGRGRAAPNPMVGAVVVRDGEVVGEGWHAEHGAAHAEAEALREAGGRARGATVYVTLEPCAHRGKTSPCTEALLDAGVRRVVVACRDPHPEAEGGAEALREAGVEVDVGVEGREAARLNARFLWRQARGAPFVGLKLALSLDARIARSPGTRTAVTGEEAWGHVHRLRAGHRAVLVGRRTVEVDDPRLTARGDVRPRRPTIRVVLDSRLRLDPSSTLARTAGEAPVWALCAPGPPADRRDRLEAAGVRVLEVGEERDGGPAVREATAAGGAAARGGREGTERAGAGLPPAAVTGRLGREGVGSVLVEGGGRVAASFLAAGVVQRMDLLYAPVVYGRDGVEGFPGLSVPEGRWAPAGRRALGRDTLIRLESRDLRRVLRKYGEAEGP